MANYKANTNLTVNFDKEYIAGESIPSGAFSKEEAERLLSLGLISEEVIESLPSVEVGVKLSKSKTADAPSDDAKTDPK